MVPHFPEVLFLLSNLLVPEVLSVQEPPGVLVFLCHQGSRGIPVSLALLEVQFSPEALSLRESPLYLGVPEDHPFLRDQRDR